MFSAQASRSGSGVDPAPRCHADCAVRHVDLRAGAGSGGNVAARLVDRGCVNLRLDLGRRSGISQRNVTTPTKIQIDAINGAQTPGWPSVYVVGSFDTRITFFSQQARGLNLACALVRAGLLSGKSRFAVVGAGAAGLAVASGLSLLLPDAEIDIYEREQDPLHLQRGCLQRNLHPHIYEWPRVGALQSRASLPLLDWEAGSATTVAAEVTTAFKTLQAHRPGLRLHTLREVTAVERVGASDCRVRLQDVDGVNPRAAAYGAVFLTIGFGRERRLAGAPWQSYWSDRGVPQAPKYADRETRILVTGGGDGGLIDLCAAALRDFDHTQLIGLVTGWPGIDRLADELIRIDGEADRAGLGFDFMEAYDREVGPALRDDGLIDAVAERLRRRVRLLFNTARPRPLEQPSSTLNRLLVYLLFRAAEQAGTPIEHHNGRISSDSAHPDSYLCEGFGRVEADEIFVRHGAAKKDAFASFAEIRDAYEAEHARWLAADPRRAVPPQLDDEARTVLEGALRALERPANQRGEARATAVANAAPSTTNERKSDTVAHDLRPYERAELERSAPRLRTAIARRLSDNAKQKLIASKNLLASYARGAVVLGASGYGKTSLAAALLREAIENRWAGTSSRVPFEVFLPDVPLETDGLQKYVYDRIRAHAPAFDQEALRAHGRSDGFVLLADGYERLPLPARTFVSTMLRSLLRDFPATQLFIFSRGQASPVGLELPTLELLEYEHDDLRELARQRSEDAENLRFAMHDAPAYIYRICRHPLIADLVLEHYRWHGRHPTQIAPLYERWLDRVLDAFSPLHRAAYRGLLDRLAEETRHGPVTVSRATELAHALPDPHATLEKLVDADAVSVRGSTLELRHEALADYLRAMRFSTLPPEAFEEELRSLEVDASSQLPFLLVATAQTAEARRVAWQALARKDLKAAIGGLRFAFGDDKASDAGPSVRRSTAFFSDILDGFDGVVEPHFADIAERLQATAANYPVARLGIVGLVSAETASYSFEDAEDGVARVRVGQGQRRSSFYGRSLRRAGFGFDAGRFFGVAHVRDALQELIKQRNLPGGPVWTEELTIGRLRHLQREYEVPITWPADVGAVVDFLRPHREFRLVAGGFSGGQTFAISELIDDLGYLANEGVAHLTPWWDVAKEPDLQTQEGRASFSRALDTYHRRRQIAYREVAEGSMPRVVPLLRTLRTMPFRFEIEVEVHDRRGHADIALHHRRWPVRSYDEAGADVSFPGILSDMKSDESVDAYVRRTEELLERFGRSFPERRVVWGQTRAPDFDGHNLFPEDQPDESAVVRGAMRWLLEDIKDLFSELPSYATV